jgi:hypothetical protein
MEADCLPVNSSWLDAIEKGYRKGKKPIMGAFNNTTDERTGRVVGRHTTGVAVYPQDFARACPMVKSMISTCRNYFRQEKQPPAFDIYYAPYTVPITHESPLIQHFWKSHSFRRDSGQIVCDFQRPYSGSPNAVSDEAVLLHGAKDSSLLHILQDAYIKGNATKSKSPARRKPILKA